MANGSLFISYHSGSAMADGDIGHVVKASSEYGGMTITDVNVVTRAAGTTDVVLMNYGSSGTVAGGTVAGISGGSAALVADTPTALAITAANKFIDADEWLVLKSDGGSLPVDTAVVIEYVEGVNTQG